MSCSLTRMVVLALALAIPSIAYAQTEYDKFDVVVAQLSDAKPVVDGNARAGQISSQIEAQRDALNLRGLSGIGVDASGGPVIDPTANVIALQRSATQRQDDLREASERFILAQIQSVKELAELRAQYGMQLREAETRRVDQLAAAEAERTDDLREAEAKRIDAIRAVDVNAAQTDADRSVEQASVLATQVTNTAENLRSLVASTATSVALAQEQLGKSLSDRIVALEQAQFIGQGRQTQSDPVLAQALQKLDALTIAQSASVGQGTGQSNVIGYIAMAIGTFGVLFGIGMALMAYMRAQAAHEPSPYTTRTTSATPRRV